MKRSIRFAAAVAAIVALAAAGAWAESIPQRGQTTNGETLLTKSAANYIYPNGTGAVSSVESFGFFFKLEEAAGNTPSVTFTVQVSGDGTNYVTMTQNSIYPATAAATASWAITAESTYYAASIHPPPLPYLRIVATEGAADDDVTLTWYLFAQ